MTILKKFALACAFMMAINCSASETVLPNEPAPGLSTKAKFGFYLAGAALVGGVAYRGMRLANTQRVLKRIKREARITRDAKQELLHQVLADGRVCERVYNLGLYRNFPHIHDIVTHQDKFLSELLTDLRNNEVVTYRPVWHDNQEVFERSREDLSQPGIGKEFLLRNVVLQTLRAEEQFLLHHCMEQVEHLVPGSRARVMELFYEVCSKMHVDSLTVFDEPTVQTEREIDRRMAEEFGAVNAPSDNWVYEWLKSCYPNCRVDALKLNWDLFKRVKRLEAMKKIVLARLRNTGNNPVRATIETLKDHIESAWRTDISRWEQQNLPHQGWTHQQNENNVPKNQNELIDAHQVLALKGILNDLNLQVDRARVALDREDEVWQRIPLVRRECMITFKTVSETLNRLTSALDASQGPHTVGCCNVLLDDAHGCCVLAWYALKGLLSESV